MSTQERRIAAGDWVVLVGASRSVRGVGKVVDASYDSRDDSLERARIEFAQTTKSFSSPDLRRVTPEDEARLVALALERGLVDDAPRLEARLRAFRGGQPFVRSPGLLNALWAQLKAERSVGLVRFFDEASDHLSEPVEVKGFGTAVRAIAAQQTTVHGRIRRPAAELYEEVLEPFDYTGLRDLMRELSVPPTPDFRISSFIAAIMRHLTLERFLEHLDEQRLIFVCKRLGVSHQGPPERLRETILMLVER